MRPSMINFRPATRAPHHELVPQAGGFGARIFIIYGALAASLALNAAWVEQYFGGGMVSPFVDFGAKPNTTVDILTGLPIAQREGGVEEPVEAAGSSAEAAAPEGASGNSSVGDFARQAARVVQNGTSAPEEEATDVVPRGASDPFAFPGEEVCGKWPSRYSTLHKQILSGEKPPRYITVAAQASSEVSPTKQVGDAFMGVATVFLIGLLTNRAIIIADPTITNVMEPAEVDWRVTGNIPMNITAGEREMEGGKNPPSSVAEDGSVLALSYMHEVPPKADGTNQISPNIVEYFGSYDKATNLLVRTNIGVLARVFSEHSRTFKALFYDHGFRLPLAYGCIFRYLMRPTAIVTEALAPALKVLQAPEVKGICVGMQGTSISGSGNKGAANSLTASADALLNCASAMEDYWFPPGWQARWVISSNLDSLRKHAAARYPDKVEVFDSAKAFKGEHQGIKAAAAEWLLFSSCHYYSIADSTFTKSAFGYNIQAPLLFLFPPLEFGQIKDECEASHGRSLLDLKKWNAM